MNLKEVRESKGLTQEQLADLCSMSKSDISKIESGNRNYTRKTLERIATALNCEVKILFKEID